MTLRSLAPLVLALGAGCISIAPEEEPTPAAPVEETSLVSFVSEGSVTFAVVDATSEESWTHVDLDAPAASEDGWDLRFQRSNVSVNGGITGDGGVEVAFLDGADFDSATAAPATGWLADSDGDDGPTWAFVGEQPWYDYDATTHVLTPHPGVWFVRTDAGAFFKLGFLDYYDDAGTSGVFAIQFAPVDAPSVEEGLALDASDPDVWVHLTLDGTVVDVDDAASDSSWDLAVQRTGWKTNSGVSGPGVGGAMLSDTPFEELVFAGTVGFAMDAMLPVPGPPGSGEFPGSEPLNAWYDYDSTTHVVSPKGVTHLVRGADGDYGALRILSWNDGQYRVELALLPRAAEVRESTLSASEDWVYWSLRLDAEVSPDDPATDTTWDLAVNRTQVRTNSGTSGPGLGGAVLIEQDFDAIAAVPETGYEADAMQPLPGPPGSGEESGNGVLGGWYDYDPITHVVSPGDRSYGLLDAEGGAVKLRVLTWDDGVWTVRWSHAGPVDLDFPSKPE